MFSSPSAAQVTPFLDQVLREDTDQAFVAHFDVRVEVLESSTSSRKELASALAEIQKCRRMAIDVRESGPFLVARARRRSSRALPFCPLAVCAVSNLLMCWLSHQAHPAEYLLPLNPPAPSVCEYAHPVTPFDDTSSAITPRRSSSLAITVPHCALRFAHAAG